MNVSITLTDCTIAEAAEVLEKINGPAPVYEKPLQPVKGEVTQEEEVYLDPNEKAKGVTTDDLISWHPDIHTGGKTRMTADGRWKKRKGVDPVKVAEVETSMIESDGGDLIPPAPSEAPVPAAVIPEAPVPAAVIPEAPVPAAVIPEAPVPAAVIPEAPVPVPPALTASDMNGLIGSSLMVNPMSGKVFADYVKNLNYENIPEFISKGTPEHFAQFKSDLLS